MHFSGMTELKFGKRIPHIVTYLKALLELWLLTQF